MSYLVLGIFSFSNFGLVGAVVLMLAHGFVSGGLFSAVGLLYDRYHSRQIEYFGGLIVGMPLFGTLFFLLLLGNFGFPLTFNFIGEFLILIGLSHINFFTYFLCGLGLFFSIIYSILLYNKLMFGNAKLFIKQLKDLMYSEFQYLLVIVVIVLFLGLVPNIVIDFIYTESMYYIYKQ